MDRALFAVLFGSSLAACGGNGALTRNVLNAWCDRFPSGWIGRQLVGRFLAAGLRDVIAYPIALQRNAPPFFVELAAATGGRSLRTGGRSRRSTATIAAGSAGALHRRAASTRGRS